MTRPGKGNRRANAVEIIKLCDKKGWSLAELAVKAGIDRKTLDRLLNGKVRMSTIASVARALGKSPDALLAPEFPSATATLGEDTHGVDLKARRDALGRLYVVLRLDRKIKKSQLQAVSKKLAAAIYSHLDLLGGFDEEGLDPTAGSLIFTMRLIPRDAKTLTDAFIDGRLARFKVVSVTILDRAFLPASFVPSGDPMQMTTTRDTNDTLTFSKIMKSVEEGSIEALFELIHSFDSFVTRNVKKDVASRAKRLYVDSLSNKTMFNLSAKIVIRVWTSFVRRISRYTGIKQRRQFRPLLFKLIEKETTAAFQQLRRRTVDITGPEESSVFLDRVLANRLSPHEKPLRREAIERLYHFIDQQPEPDRFILLLRMYGFTFTQIAKQVGYSVRKVRKSYTALIDKLKANEDVTK